MDKVVAYETAARDPVTGKLDAKALKESEGYQTLKAQFNYDASVNGFKGFDDPVWKKLINGTVDPKELRTTGTSPASPALGGSTEQTTAPANPAQPTTPQIPATVKERTAMALKQPNEKAGRLLGKQNANTQQPQPQEPMPEQQAQPQPMPQAQPRPNLPSQQIEQPLDKLKADPAKEFANTQSNPYQGLYGKDKTQPQPMPQGKNEKFLYEFNLPKSNEPKIGRASCRERV